MLLLLLGWQILLLSRILIMLLLMVAVVNLADVAPATATLAQLLVIAAATAAQVAP